MGNTKSYSWTDNASGNYSSVKLSGSPSPERRRNAGVVVLSEDPRSPTISIPRTPIEIEHGDDSIQGTPVLKMCTKFPYSTEGTNTENCGPREGAVELKEDSAFLNVGAGTGQTFNQKINDQRTPLRDYSKPSLLLRYKQSRRANKALKEDTAHQDEEQSSRSNK